MPETQILILLSLDELIAELSEDVDLGKVIKKCSVVFCLLG